MTELGDSLLLHISFSPLRKDVRMQKKNGARHFKRVGKLGATTACDVDDVGIPAIFKQCEANPASRMTTGLRASAELNDNDE